MSTTCKHTNPLQRQGTAQVQRLLEALVPENVKLHEIGVEGWMKFARNYASQINFYSDSDSNTPIDDWEEFFIHEDQVEDFLKTIDSGDTSPHLSLFVAFLNLLQYPQQSINGIPKRHLEFYYGEVLQLSPREFTPDSVHVLFELAKNATSELVAKASNFEAGKDSEGKLLNYELDDSIVVNQAKVSEIKSLFLNDGNTLKYASQSNTKDGLEEELDDDLTWSGFGDENWPDIPVEVALSSDVLLLKEGNRTVIVEWETANPITILNAVTVMVTGEEGWLDPLDVVLSNNNKTWTFEIPEDVDPVGKYNETFHERRIATTKPTILFLFNDPSRYGNFQNVTITSAKIKVDVSGIKNLSIKNELGFQNADTPFMPFGPRPKKNSSMTIDVDEFIDKNITGFDINMPYLNMPANFYSHYTAYNTEIEKQKTLEAGNIGYLKGHMSLIAIQESFTIKDYIFEESETSLIEADSRRAEFKVLVSSPYNSSTSTHEMFNQPQIPVNVNKPYTKGGQIEVKLLSSFYHDLYNPIYVSVITGATGAVNIDSLPKEPYTPLTSGLSINYTAESKVTFDSDPTAFEKDVEIHHMSPFGTELKTKQTTLVSKVFQNTLFVGLENANPRDLVSILFQVAEGSEDPDESTFLPGEEITWSVLNEEGAWMPLDEEYIIGNTTNNFLKSGIVQITLPKETGLKHYLLETDRVWLKLALNKVPTSVSKFYNIHAQAAVATFVNKENTFEHLNSGLNPETISQLALRKSKIKSVTQPYTSFGGKSTESDDHFYRRISERLRHKDRAVTIWDYERLILQDFPQLHMVKCLNHTLKNATEVDEMAPGNVSIVVIPKIKDSGSEYRLKPKVSQNTKDVIKAFLVPRKPMQVELEVVNPIYEEVEFNFKVKFYEQYDFNYYKTIIKEDLKAYLSPWIRDEELNLTFGRSIYTYEVINFIENLEYVDYLEDFLMSHKPYGKDWEVKNEIFPSNSLAVLVAAADHPITEALNC